MATPVIWERFENGGGKVFDPNDKMLSQASEKWQSCLPRVEFCSRLMGPCEQI